jgi:N-acetylglucosaminyldiphosphoundecaprenol N-acetyl-beta-D-mannosaminyltransferase
MPTTGGTVLGIRIGPNSLEELVGSVERVIESNLGPFVVACANPHSLVVARTDGPFRTALENASAVVADGVGCLVAGAVAGVSVGPRITGCDLFAAVMTTLNKTAGRAYFFGASRETLEILQVRVRRDFPRVTFAAHSPPFGTWSSEENRGMVEHVRNFRPDVLWVGMTAPKQEKWVSENIHELGVPVVGSIGAVFDFYAGTTRRAPQWICDLGFEWLYRLPREPRRLWKRTFVSAPIFLWLVLLERLRGVTVRPPPV